MFKNIIAIAALATATVAVQAADFSISTGTQQAVGQHQGIGWGSVTSESKGNAIAAAQIAGAGTSSQWANSNTLGSSTIGAKPDGIGVTLMTGSNQDSKVNAGGSITGNVQVMDGTSIANGAAALANSFGTAKMDGNFESKVYGSYHHDAAQLSYQGF